MFKESGNNRVLPPNARASDVASKAIEELVDVQQRKYDEAFRVQGFECALYSRLASGPRCSCQGERALASRFTSLFDPGALGSTQEGEACKTSPVPLGMRGSILGPDGKAPIGVINQILTGHEFGVARYGDSHNAYHDRVPETSKERAEARRKGLQQFGDEFTILDESDMDRPEVREALRKVSSPHAPSNVHQGTFSLVHNGRPEGTGGASQDYAEHARAAEQIDRPGYVDPSDRAGEQHLRDLDVDFGDNGPVRELDIDELVGDVDIGVGMGWGDSGCPVCFGTGYVGGFSLLYGTRMIVDIPNMILSDECEVLVQDRPWKVHGPGFSVQVVLPKGAVSVDSVTLWNRNRKVPMRLYIMGVEIKSLNQVLAFCQGVPMLVTVEAGYGEFTHLELQFGVSTESAFFEFPKMQKSSDLSFLDNTDPFGVVMSPKIPMIRAGDVFSDSVYQKVMVVQSVTPWQTRSAHNLGWEAQVRVAQPQELLNLLPRRQNRGNHGKMALRKNPSESPTQGTRIVRDNSVGIRRT